MANTGIDCAAQPVDASGVRVVPHVYVSRDTSHTTLGAVAEVMKSR